MIENILLITIDSLRIDHVPAEKTETFTALASEGVSFDHAFATGPGTTSSFPAMLTGTLPLSYGGLGPLSTDRPRVASELGDRGLATGAFHSNPFLSTHFEYDIGFDAFKDYQNPLMGVATRLFPRGIEVNNPRLQKVDEVLNLTGLLKRAYTAVSGKSRPYVGADVITDDTIEWLDETDEPFFCWTHYMDVHQPCFPPADVRRDFGLEEVTAEEVSEWYSTALENPQELTEMERDRFNRLYDASIAYTDRQIGRIVDHLKSMGRWEETLVVLTSDHGELFGEYDSYGKPIRMYDELLRIPLVVVHGPEYLEDAAGELCSLLDLPPLFHDVLDEDVPDSYEGRLPDHEGYREYAPAEHHVEDGLVVGARSRQQLYEYSEIQDERGFFDVGPETFESIPNADGDQHLRTAVSERLDVIDASVEMANLDADVERRLEDLGYR